MSQSEGLKLAVAHHDEGHEREGMLQEWRWPRNANAIRGKLREIYWIDRPHEKQTQESAAKTSAHRIKIKETKQKERCRETWNDRANERLVKNSGWMWRINMDQQCVPAVLNAFVSELKAIYLSSSQFD